jgi:hypothetical protein
MEPIRYIFLIANYEMASSSRTVMNVLSYCLGNYKRDASGNTHGNMDQARIRLSCPLHSRNGICLGSWHFLLYVKCTFVDA